MSESAVIFDLDGVISDTAAIHAAVWKIVFDSVLERHIFSPAPFSVAVDYKQYVDGRSRLVGIESFLRSRGIILHRGDDDDDSLETVHGIGNCKNTVFRRLLAQEGAEFFDDAKDLIQGLRAADVDLGIASSSKNATFVLNEGGLTHHFKAILDGLVAEERHIKSKPSPEFFGYAASLLGVEAGQCIALDDAIAGVMSAKKAGIGFVVGVSRNGNPYKLFEAGADLVVGSLFELSVDSLRYGPRAMLEAPLRQDVANLYSR